MSTWGKNSMRGFAERQGDVIRHVVTDDSLDVVERLVELHSQAIRERLGGTIIEKKVYTDRWGRSRGIVIRSALD